MRKLKMLTRGPNKNYRRGQIVEVDDQRAAHLLKGKHAVDATATTAAEEETEEVTDDSLRTEGL